MQGDVQGEVYVGHPMRHSTGLQAEVYESRGVQNKIMHQIKSRKKVKSRKKIKSRKNNKITRVILQWGGV